MPTIDNINDVNEKITIPVTARGILSTCLLPVTLWSVPMMQRFSYWLHMNDENGDERDYDTYRKDHGILAPLVLEPMATLGNIRFKPIIYFRNCTSDQFKNDIKKTQVMIGNHVGYNDFTVFLQLAVYYGVESNFIAYFMNSLNNWPVIGPTLWGQMPLARDGSDDTILNERLKMFAESTHEHLFAIFPEGGLRRNPKLYLRTVTKNQQYGLNLEYIHFPKVKGFTKLIEIVGKKINSLYEFTLLYEKNRRWVNNHVKVIVTKVCDIGDIPTSPSDEYVEKYNLAIDDSNRLHYAHEEFLLKRFIIMDNELKAFYSNLKEDERPTIKKLYEDKMNNKKLK